MVVVVVSSVVVVGNRVGKVVKSEDVEENDVELVEKAEEEKDWVDDDELEVENDVLNGALVVGRLVEKDVCDTVCEEVGALEVEEKELVLCDEEADEEADDDTALEDGAALLVEPEVGAGLFPLFPLSAFALLELV